MPTDALQYPNKKHRPDVYDWRNNLTVLSQCYNLYVVACGSQLHVHRPTFPLQRLERVALKWELPKSGANRPGYNDPRHPHGINQIVVGELGECEILVCVCDDGDVVAYTTKSILDVLDARDASPVRSEPEVSDAHIRPLLVRNVRKSAWGIAIHKNARLIAVSSNTCKITVFPMGTVLGDPQTESTYHLMRQEKLEQPDPKSDPCIVLQGHHHNVPNLAFCNTSDDKDGRFLVSIAIDGTVIVWDVWQAKPVQEVRTHRPLHSNSVGWQVACIQKQWFRLVDNEMAFLGASDVPLVNDCYHFDHTRCNVTNSGPWAISPKGPAPGTPSIQVTGPMADHDADGADSETDYGDGEDEFEEDEDDWYDNLDTDVDMDFLVEMSGLPNDDLQSFGTHAAAHPLSTGSLTETYPLPNVSVPDEPVHLMVPFGAQTLLHNTQPAPSAPHPAPAMVPPAPSPLHPPLKRRGGIQERVDWLRFGHPSFPFHLVVAGREHVALHAPPSLAHPITNFARPCHQETPRLALGTGTLSPHHQRLNLLHVLPELGAVVAATQFGRVAVFALTRWRRPAVAARARARVEASPPQDRCGLRLDWLLPFEAQERADERPTAPLLGIAVAPLQSWDMVSGGAAGERPDGVPRSRGRKWRLLLTYQDLTVLSYELSRGGGKEWESDELLLI